MTTFSVIKKSAGYSVKSFINESKARDFANSCCKAQNNNDFIVCIWNGGMFVEL